MIKKISAICCMLMLVISTIYCGSIHVSAEEYQTNNVKSACLMDYESGEILFENEADKKLPVASMVKLMTILLTFEEIEKGNINLTDKVRVSENASGMGGSQVFIDANEEYILEDLLKSVIVSSANDSSVALAEHICGDESVFVSRMNERAKTLGMINTSYANCTGLPAPSQFSTARDTTILNRELLKHENYHKYSTIWMETFTHPSGRETGLVNTNKLIRYFKGCDGGKTGSTDEAGYCLSASAKRGNMRLISTICGAVNSKERFNQCSSLLSFGFANFENKKIIDKSLTYASKKVKGSKTSEIELIAKEDFYAVIKKADKNTNYSYTVSCEEYAKAPIKAGDVCGKLTVLKNDVVIKEIDLVSKSDADKITYFDSVKKITGAWAF